MKRAPAALTPFIRSDAVGAVLAELFLHPDAELTLSELGRRSSVSAPILHREISRLVESDVVVDHIEGRNRLVRANKSHPLYSLMSQLVLATYGPVPVVRGLFGGIDSISELLTFGSWVARRAGIAGPYPNDVDVLVVGGIPRRTLSEQTAVASERLNLAVNITRLTEDEWHARSTAPFVATVRSRPMLDVLTGELRQ